jgi:hypothetical protein
VPSDWPEIRNGRDRQTGISDQAEYEALFAPATTESAIGEASTMYLYLPWVPARIAELKPDMKLIAILRHPVDRAFSHYCMRVGMEAEPLKTFEEAVEAEPDRVARGDVDGTHYLGRGFYSAQIRRYLDLFPREQLRIYLYDDLREDAVKLSRDAFRFLEVDDRFEPDTSLKQNVGEMPKSRALHDFLTRENPTKAVLKAVLPPTLRKRMATAAKDRNLLKPVLSPDTRRRLTGAFREDILNLQDLLSRDLSAWLN